MINEYPNPPVIFVDIKSQFYYLLITTATALRNPQEWARFMENYRVRWNLEKHLLPIRTKQVDLTLKLKSTQAASRYFCRRLIDPGSSTPDLVSCNNLSTLGRMRKEQTDGQHNRQHKCRHVCHRKPRICWHVWHVASLRFFRLNIHFYVLITLSCWSFLVEV